MKKSAVSYSFGGKILVGVAICGHVKYNAIYVFLQLNTLKGKGNWIIRRKKSIALFESPSRDDQNLERVVPKDRKG